ncbi:YihY/virulence factor BrkB family protein [Mobilicoccus pelagius]|uniref:Uncharacterized protein n=1 Tax=Mobilicoccus pelagius NBRC 104925 TaxID=1089455 RepID=H5UUD6_9MICO|nr:YihY/virulence factor BrkB family protein [Mobilicoccus pelagius]GAB49344.1 hypothetical protein MOPEL_113_00240 [Mobilicoccus pelagius NBRC 104925]
MYDETDDRAGHGDGGHDGHDGHDEGARRRLALRRQLPPKRESRCALTPATPPPGTTAHEDRRPRGTRPTRTGLARDHDAPLRGRLGCRHTHGLEDVWSARHAGNVDAVDDVHPLPRTTTMTQPAEGTSAAKAETAPAPDAPVKPSSPTEIRKPSWRYTARKAAMEFLRDGCTDAAAALTYFSVLSLFPALLAMISLLGVFGQGQRTVDSLMEMAGRVVPSDILSVVEPVLDSMVKTQAAGFALVTGLLIALWSASNYVNAFSRAMNRVYEVDEGRPIWKARPIFLLLTLVILMLISAIGLGLALSGPVAHAVGDLVGLGDTAVMVWDVAKWPVIVALVILIVALLYYVTPNVQQPKFRWLSVGSTVAILLWIVVSVAFGFYVANFGNYNKTYGSLGGVIVFLLWLWITNNALLFGAEIDAELERSRQLQAGIEAEETLQLPPRDTTVSEKNEAKRERVVEQGRRIRLSAEHAEDRDPSEGSDGRRGGSSAARG